MTRNHIIAIGMAIVVGLCGISAFGQRASVGVAEVTGTFEHRFTGRFAKVSEKIEIASAGRGKLHVYFDLVYPFIDANKELDANTGQLDAYAAIDGDTAVYTSDSGDCRITIKFVRAGLIKVTTDEDEAECGFGLNVTADGTYKKTSSAKPSFVHM